MRILVCGSRHYSDVINIFKELNEAVFYPPIVVDAIIEGGARGVDTIAKGWANSLKIPVEEYPANWEEYGKTAGPIRNRQMLKEGKPDLVIAFLAKDSRGTKDMINAAEEAGVPVKVINV